MSDLQQYFSTKQKKKKQKRFIFSILSLVVAVGLFIWGAWWVIIKSPLLQVAHIEVKGTNYLSPDIVAQTIRRQIEEKDHPLQKWLGANNILAWPSGKMDSPEKLFANVQEVILSKQIFSRKIVAEVTERARMGAWCANNECYWFDEKGVIYQKSTVPEGASIIKVNDKTGRSFKTGDIVLPDFLLTHFLTVLKVLTENSLSVKEINVNDLSQQEITVILYKGPELRFSLKFSSINANTAIAYLVKNKTFYQLEYIDFRVENRVYYK